jgi:diguanylate cyclase (GGDEF)-like protein
MVGGARTAQTVRTWDLWTLPRPLIVALLLLHTLTACVIVAAGRSGGEVHADQLVYAGVAVAGIVASRLHASWIPAETEHSYGQGQRVQISADDCWLAALALGAPTGLGVAAILASQLVIAVGHRGLYRVSPQRWTLPAVPSRAAFVASANTLGVAVAHQAFVTTGGGTSFDVRGVLAAAVAIASFQLVATGLLLLVLRLATHVRWQTLIAREAGIVRAQLSQQCLGVLIWASWASARWSLVFVFPLLLSFERAQRHRSLLEQAQTDAKTGLANLSYWQSRAEATLARNHLNGVPANVLIVDLDHFKRINDTHGHLVGDAVLVAAAERIAGAVRPTDLVGRFGGEEFAVFLSPADGAEASAVAERIRTAVSHAPATTSPDGAEVSVTCSIGVASIVSGAPAALTDALSRADLALYGAKASGRNRVEVAAAAEDERSSTPAHVRWTG